MPTSETPFGLAAEADDPFFARQAHDVIGRALADAVGLTPRQRQLAYDVRRGRRQLTVLRELCDIFAHCPSRDVATGLGELVRGTTLRRRARIYTDPLSILETYRMETEWQARGDLAQSAAIVNPSKSTYEAALHSLGGHGEWLRLQKDAFQLALAPAPRALILVP